MQGKTMEFQMKTIFHKLKGIVVFGIQEPQMSQPLKNWLPGLRIYGINNIYIFMLYVSTLTIKSKNYFISSNKMLKVISNSIEGNKFKLN